MTERRYGGLTLAALEALEAIDARYTWDALPDLIARIRELEATLKIMHEGTCEECAKLIEAQRIPLTEEPHDWSVGFNRALNTSAHAVRMLAGRTFGTRTEDGLPASVGLEAWQPIDTAPKDGTPVLLCGDPKRYGKPVWIGWWMPEPHGCWSSFGRDGSVVGWRPLPSPPAQEDQ